ncbi:MAG: AraC family transcriptional regulator ligand-binding domain-containing protein [Pseudomonadota bacterium]
MDNEGKDFPDPKNLRHGIIASDTIAAVMNYVVKKGISVDRVLDQAGVPVGIGSAKEIPAIAGPNIFNAILDTGVGVAPSLEVAEEAPFSFFGGLERAVMLAPNGLTALRTFEDNFAAFHSGLATALTETSSFVVFSLRFDGDERDNGCCNEVVLGALTRLMRSTFGQRCHPYEVRLRHTPNGDRSAYNEFFGRQPVYRSNDHAHSLVFRKEDLEHRQPLYNPDLFLFARSQLRQKARKRASRDMPQEFLELWNVVSAAAWLGVFRADAVADGAGFSLRTAQRIARRNGRMLGDMIDEARLKLLRETVRNDPEASADDLALRVGYSDGRALRRALKSWTGQPLSQFRQRTVD